MNLISHESVEASLKVKCILICPLSFKGYLYEFPNAKAEII